MKRVIMIAESFFKDSSLVTDTNLKTDTSWGGSSGISGNLVVTTPDNQTPELRQLYLVSIEPVSLNPGEHQRDGYKRILAEREATDDQGFGKSRRVFRDA